MKETETDTNTVLWTTFYHQTQWSSMVSKCKSYLLDKESPTLSYICVKTFQDSVTVGVPQISRLLKFASFYLLYFTDKALKYSHMDSLCTSIVLTVTVCTTVPTFRQTLSVSEPVSTVNCRVILHLWCCNLKWNKEVTVMCKVTDVQLPHATGTDFTLQLT